MEDSNLISIIKVWRQKVSLRVAVCLAEDAVIVIQKLPKNGEEYLKGIEKKLQDLETELEHDNSDSGLKCNLIYNNL